MIGLEGLIVHVINHVLQQMEKFVARLIRSAAKLIVIPRIGGVGKIVLIQTTLLL
jgi:hypothetical protein